jgi:hypothetical protein
MKKITLFLFTLSLSLVYGQVPTIDFETNGSNYIAGAEPANTFTIGAGSGTNTTMVANLANSTSQYGAYQIILTHEVDFSTAAKTVSFDFYQSAGDVAARQILVKFQDGDTDTFATNGYEVEVTAAATVGWQTLQFDFSNARASYPNSGNLSLAGSYTKMYIFIDFGVAVPSNTAIDNIGGAAQGAAIVDPNPSTAAPTPPARLAADVVSIYSDAYSVISGINLDAGWCGGGAITNTTAGGNAILAYNNQACQGIDFTANPQDFTGFTNLHLDFFIAVGTDLVGKVFNIKEVPVVGGEITHTLDINALSPVPVPGEWYSYDLAVNLPQTTVKQIGVTSNLNNAVWYDNLYYHKNTTLNTKNFEIASLNVYPNPTQNSWTVKTNNIQMLNITVFDVLGKNVLSLSPNASEATINGLNLKSGLYFAQIKTANGLSSIKLIKK